MESFKSHLCSRLSNTLSSQSSDCFSRFNNALIDLFDIDFEKKFELNICDTMKRIFQILLIFLILQFNPRVILFKLIGFFFEVLSQYLQKIMLKGLI